ncbi:hypothetical protein IF1G_11043 [Cordyceps javanica]|uniref:Uncharacterized protein n=1 Tax=Cordyceps javanica TaxID=43265 RepID=A0A545VJB3_9HYPO|nr:hypothetical protein IF1G_11043 [Cordyceps javanica]TQW01746.1 hypothetical protein IF2G_10728 [Cordyceps javanica]
MASQQYDLPVHTQHLLAILEGYSFRINALRQRANALATDNIELKKKIEDANRQLEFHEGEFARQANLIDCQDHHIRTLDDIRLKSKGYSSLTVVQPSTVYAPYTALHTSKDDDMFPN